jgi:hypothetical protein
MLKTMMISAVAVLLTGGAAWAQSTSYYGPNGQYSGSARTYSNGVGATTSYYGANGQYIGSGQTYSNGVGSTTSYYGANGQYRGRASRY